MMDDPFGYQGKWVLVILNSPSQLRHGHVGLC